MTKRKYIRVVVSGGRDYTDGTRVAAEMRKLERKANKAGYSLVLITGGARGLDSLVQQWCDETGTRCIVMPAPWNSAYSKSAGPIRNQWMIDVCEPNYAVIFPGGRGTADMQARVAAAGINFHVVPA